MCAEERDQPSRRVLAMSSVAVSVRRAELSKKQHCSIDTRYYFSMWKQNEDEGHGQKTQNLRYSEIGETIEKWTCFDVFMVLS